MASISGAPSPVGVATLDATRCPLCGEANRCAEEIARATGEAQLPCWCMRADFSQASLARVPQALRGLACICAHCAAQAAPSSELNSGL
jgi:hypothetical protein